MGIEEPFSSRQFMEQVRSQNHPFDLSPVIEAPLLPPSQFASPSANIRMQNFRIFFVG
jgi:hypothetical protein